jgi:hypothetical protein
MALGDVFGSPLYWGALAALALAFGVVDFLTFDRRNLGRPQGWAIALYLMSFAIVGVVVVPLAPVGSRAWLFPLALRIGVTVVVVGGSLLGGGAAMEQNLRHPERRPPIQPKPEISEAELRAAEDYDKQWQAEDRRHNHEVELRSRQEHERHHTGEGGE